MTTTVKAHSLPPDLLSEGMISSKAQVDSETINYLSLEPRPPQVPFDEDGPGELSLEGSRHDNDHVDIRNIQILPTTDEILAVHRKPYIPKKGFHEKHHLEWPMMRLVDTLFRQLRFDNIEPLSDISYSAAQKLVLDPLRCLPDYQVLMETDNGNRYYLYRDIRFEEILVHERKGLIVRVSFACPSFLRGRHMQKANRLEEGMLCALLGLDEEDYGLSVTFMEVHLRQSTYSMDSKGGEGLRAAVQLSFTQKENKFDVVRLVRYAYGLAIGHFFLVEFPKTLYAGFFWCLKRLQEMEPSHVAFQNYIAPTIPSVQLSQGQQNPYQGMPILRPAYTTREGFQLDLSCLTKSKVRFPASALTNNSIPSFIDFLKRETTLDEGQAIAFAESMCREITFTQGPPGTGKTFLGIALARTILASRTTNPKPILVVCLTNHALDSFLEGLINAGEDRVARVGGRSREEWIKKYTLTSLARKAKIHESDARERSANVAKIMSTTKELDAITGDLNAVRFNNTVRWHAVKALLRTKHTIAYQQLAMSTGNPTVQSFIFDYWARGRDLKDLADLKKEFELYLNIMQDNSTHIDLDLALSNIAKHVETESKIARAENIWKLPLTDRTKLLESWKADIDYEDISRQLIKLHFELQQAIDQQKAIRQKLERDVLLKQDIIGLTTTACASNWDLLKSLDLEVVICEEAAEVLEAHTLCTLLPSIEHAIFIGDPLQLRPDVQQIELSMESSSGKDYRLDESLFERFMVPQDPTLRFMPMSRLLVQRRMHPEISTLTRTTYPYLLDHTQTLSNPEPIGLHHRTYWLDHDFPETSPSDDTRSYSNMHEVDMITAFVRYLLGGNGYSLGQIAVLTPYNGQLAALYEAMKSTCRVWLNEKDRITLIENGLLGEKTNDSMDQKETVRVSDMLRIATIDNFQGEEAKIVILSTVRSGGATGFLKTRNRINVACSRARDGFYIIGNSRTLRSVPMWSKIVDIFIANNRIGTALKVGCTRHLQSPLHVAKPSDFDQVQPCLSLCGESLSCGHICQELCHPVNLHEGFKCQVQCEKVLACGHTCRKKCFQECGPCSEPISSRDLPCGHTVQIICGGYEIKCQTIIGEFQMNCGHARVLRCSEIGQTYECHEACNTRLDCGHLCTGQCLDCDDIRHQPCSNKCGRLLECGHHCDAKCHTGDESAPCPPCQKQCMKTCIHGRCQNSCSMTCDPCTKLHETSCTHRPMPTVLCSLPPDASPCNEPCPKVLNCGHPCPGICGELCLEDHCPVCETGKASSRHLILVPQCNCLLDVESLDIHVVDSRKALTLDKWITDLGIKSIPVEPTCLCGSSLRSVNRYAFLTRLASLPYALDQFFEKISKKFDSFTRQLRWIECNLGETWHHFCESIRPNPLASKENFKIIGSRAASLLELHKSIMEFRDSVILPFQKSMAQLTNVHPNVVPNFALCLDLRAELIGFRAITSMLQDTLKVAHYIAPLPDQSLGLARLAVLLRENALKRCIQGRVATVNMVEQAKRLSAPCLEVELGLQYLGFTHFESIIQNVESTSTMSLEIDPNHLKALCRRYPNTAGRFTTSVMDFVNSFAKPLHHRGIQLPANYAFSHAEFNHLWGQYVKETLTTCPNKHPYSSEAFKDGCPECGKEVEVAEEEARKYGGQLQEEKFLQCMNSMWLQH